MTRDGNPFLMEVNTRIQVENGVSAKISRIKGHDDIDLVAEQIRTGLGEPLGYTQNAISFEGRTLEYRIIAESPENTFTPWVGTIDRFRWGEHPWLSVYTHVPKQPYVIPTESDPNLALVIIWGQDLDEL